jgi:hypothetical protein
LRPQGFFHRLCAVIKRDNEHLRVPSSPLYLCDKNISY